MGMALGVSKWPWKVNMLLSHLVSASCWGRMGLRSCPLPGLNQTGLVINQAVGITVPLRVFWDLLTLFLFRSIHQYRERE